MAHQRSVFTKTAFFITSEADAAQFDKFEFVLQSPAKIYLRPLVLD